VQDAAGPLDPVRESVRRHPAAWAVGGALAGMVAVRAFGARFVRGGRRLAGAWVEQRFGDVILGVAMKAAASVRSEFQTHGAPDGKGSAPSAAEVAEDLTAATGPEDSQSVSGS
jgi:hypothetical protein